MKKIIYILLVLIICNAIIMFLLNKKNGISQDIINSTETQQEKTNDISQNETSVIDNNVRYYSGPNNKFGFVFSSMASKVTDYKTLNKKVFIKETSVETISTEPIYEILENLEFKGEYYTYGYYTKEELDKYDLANDLKCDNTSTIELGEGATRKCKEHEVGFKYDKIDSEMIVIIGDKVINIKPNDWSNINNYKETIEEAGLKCDPINEDVLQPSLYCKDDTEYMVLNIHKSGEVVAHDKGYYCYIGNDLATWCNTITP